jgi:threonine/homoserine/homoserine lactone efflux protein
VVFVLASGVSAWRWGGLVMAIGITVGMGVHAALAAVGTGALLRAVPELAEAIRLAGAAYPEYLA